jgi:signal transduction histidine kinase/ActR/RegA family two-component response regulator
VQHDRHKKIMNKKPASLVDSHGFFMRILLPTILTICLFVVTLFCILIPTFERSILERKREMIRDLTQTACSLLAELEALEQSGKLTRIQAQQQAIDRIQFLRYGEELKDYFWITDMEPRMLVHPYRPELNGTLVAEYEDPAGKKLFSEFVAVVRHSGEGYVDYMWQWKDDENRIVPKLSFVMGFQPWGWIVGTGIYIEDVKDEIATITRRLLLLSVGITVAMTFLLLFISWQSLAIEKHRQSAEKALRESEEKFRHIFLACPMGMYLYRLDDNDRLILVDANAQADTMTGVANQEKIGLPIEEAFPALANTEVPQHYRVAARDGTPYHIANLTYKDADIDGLYDVYTFRTSPSQIAVMFNEVTERKNLEEQLRQSQKMESIGQLAGGIAHDFNNLLTGILGYVDLILTQLNETDPITSMVLEIKKAGNRAASLTRQLLAFSRKQVLKTRVVHLNDLIRGLDAMLHRLIGENIKIVTALHEGVWPIKADPGQLEQIIVNMALNARDAMPQGGTLTIETENRTRHEKNQPGTYAVLRICDTGCGMTPDILSHVFEPFFTTKPKDKGTGLGLSMVYGIVKQSEGDIDVQSEPNQGTVFELFFPRTTDTSAHLLPPTSSPEPGEEGSETILVVEDEEMVRSLIVTILESSGYQVLQAGYCDQAFHIHETHAGPIHLLITDVILPKKSGKEIANVIQAARPDMHVLFVSGYTDDAITHHRVLDADVHFMQKPFTAAMLKKKIREIFHNDTTGTGLED